MHPVPAPALPFRLSAASLHFHDALLIVPPTPPSCYAHNDPSYTYSSLRRFLSSAVRTSPQLAATGRLASLPCVRNVPKHSRTSSTNMSGASNAGSWLGRWCRLTHVTSHDPEPHMTGVVLLLLRAWKQLTPRGTGQ
jgi:hypothetical protein